MQRLYRTIAEALRRQIEDGGYQVGEKLPAERVLAEQFCVSRPTVREAMIALEIAGFVSVKVGSGVYVVNADGQRALSDELDVGPFELMEARRVIEAEIAALAAERITPLQLARLEELLKAMARENSLGAVGEQADRAFHLTIAQASQNSALSASLERLWDLRETSPMVRDMLNRARASGIQPMVHDHRKIVGALRAGDAEQAHSAMSSHIARVIDDLLQVTETDELEQVKREAEARRARYGGGTSS